MAILSQTPHHSYSYLGCGLGLRTAYYDEILATNPPVDWFEIISEDYFCAGGNPRYYLNKIHEKYPIVMHGVSLSIGGTDPLNKEYLAELKKLSSWLEPEWISDHCCWTSINGVNIHDLMPLPYTEEALHHIAQRVDYVQDFLGRPLVLENVSSYVNYTHSMMSEWEFLSELTKITGCYLLLDINNIYVSAYNHGFNPTDFINGIPKGSVQQFHLAGHTNKGTHILDTHDAPVIEQVWALYEMALQRFGKISTLIERDDHFPPFNELMDELAHAKNIIARQCDKSSTQQVNFHAKLA